MAKAVNSEALSGLLGTLKLPGCPQSEGLVLIKMSGRKHGAYFGKTVLIFTQASGEDLPFHRFRYRREEGCARATGKCVRKEIHGPLHANLQAFM